MMLIQFLRDVRASLTLMIDRPRFRPALDVLFLNHPAAGREMEEGRFEPEETQWFRDQLLAHEVLINIGANTGYYALMAARQGLKTVAIEPESNNFKFLIRNVHANSFENFELYPVALSDSAGVVELHGASTGASLVRNWANQIGFTLAPAVALDTILGNRFREQRVLVVCDVEGSELSVLKGASEFLKSALHLTILLELTDSTQHHPSGENPNYRDTLNLMESMGFHLAVLDSRGQERDISYEAIRGSDRKKYRGESANLVFKRS